MNQQLTIWTNAWLSPQASALLQAETATHRLVMATELSSEAARSALSDADVAFGQPDAEVAMNSRRLRWIHITSAGYTAYDREDFRSALRERGALFTNSSSVYDEPCAQHTLAMMLADARQLLPSHRAQLHDRNWSSGERRAHSYLLNGQNLLILGYGAIARRLIQLLAPFDMKITVLRRQPQGDESVTIVGEEHLTDALAQADHVVNILPESGSTRGFMNTARFAVIKSGARFYNIGRGATVDQDALLHALESGRLSLAYVDVTEPEPLPAEHALWSAPNCFITPHSAGGHAGESERLVQHFVSNLRAFCRSETLTNVVMP